MRPEDWEAMRAPRLFYFRPLEMVRGWKEYRGMVSLISYRSPLFSTNGKALVLLNERSENRHGWWKVSLAHHLDDSQYLEAHRLELRPLPEQR